jgi:hypothetical protein
VRFASVLPLFDCAFGLRWQSASGDTAFATDATPKSGVALRFPPQSKTLHPTVSGPKRKMRLATRQPTTQNLQPQRRPWSRKRRSKTERFCSRTNRVQKQSGGLAQAFRRNAGHAEGAAPVAARNPRYSRPVAATVVMGAADETVTPFGTPGPSASIHTRRQLSSTPLAV